MYGGITMYRHVVDNSIIGGYIPFSMQMAKAGKKKSGKKNGSYGYTALYHCQSADLVFSAANLHGDYSDDIIWGFPLGGSPKYGK